MSESTMTRALTKRLRESGVVVLACVGGGRQGAGWPDRYVAHPWWRGWVEFKLGNGRLTALQRIMLERLRRVGVSVAVARWHASGGMQIEREDGTYLAGLSPGFSVADLLEALHDVAV